MGGASLQLLIHSYVFAKTTRVVVTREKRSVVVIGYIIMYNHLGNSWNLGIHRMCNLILFPSTINYMVIMICILISAFSPLFLIAYVIHIIHPN